MALRTPPSWLQNGSHPAENDRLTTQALYSSTGIIGASSLAITAQGSPNMTVNAATGWCAVQSSTANGGVYVAYNDATTVLTITTANPTLPRIDRIVVTVSDAYYSGATNTVAFQVLAGTPNASPTAPATPSDSISLATIAVAAAASSIGAANITDTRTATTSSSFLPLTGGTVTGATTFSGTLAISGATTVTNTISSNTTITAASFTPSAGTTAIAPLKLTSGTNLTSPQAGAFEYNGSTAFFTPVATSGRGVSPADYYYQLGTSGNSLFNNTLAQSIFSVGINLTAGRYEFEIVALLSTGNSAKNTTFSVSGTGSTSGPVIVYSISRQGKSAGSPQTVMETGSLGTVLFSGTSTDQFTALNIRGMFQWSAGTFIPTVQFSALPGGSNSVVGGSYIRIRRVDNTNTSNPTSIGAWA
jgi:hypothetical protein